MESLDVLADRGSTGHVNETAKHGQKGKYQRVSGAFVGPFDPRAAASPEQDTDTFCQLMRVQYLHRTL